MKRSLLVGLALCAFISRPHATTVRPFTFAQLVAESATIIRGEVTAVRSGWRDGSRDSPIVTTVSIRVTQTLKGEPRPDVELEFLGGSVGDRTLTVSDMPKFGVGDRDFLFLSITGRSLSPLVGFFVGRWPIHRDILTGREFVTTSDGRPLSDAANILAVPAARLSDMTAHALTATMSVADVDALITARVQAGR